MKMPLNEEQGVSEEQQSAAQPSVELVQEIIVAVQEVIEGYKKQLGMSSELVKREWRLTLRAILMAMAGTLLLVIVGSIIWLVLNGMIALGLYELGVHIAIVSLVIILLNMLTGFGLIVLIRRLLSQIGFKRSWSAITMSS